MPDTGKHALFCYCFEQKRVLQRQWSPDGTREGETVGRCYTASSFTSANWLWYSSA